MKISLKVNNPKQPKKPKQKFGLLLFSVEFVLVYKHSDVTRSLSFHSVELIFEYTENKLRYCKNLENDVHGSLFVFKGESCVGMQLWQRCVLCARSCPQTCAEELVPEQCLDPPCPLFLLRY